ncbi:MAG: fasciclin domain-containing protein [Methylomonas sp.]|jgi:hypothetical protein|uniref:fasciclin domain-containing protein n=1 Tax=Methylomonas sp. TaxID=418 RepID=UPI0025D934D5|nr:fasciclin domain-containing protein [Methylomonas sp.]MCK9607507.1 fasciclin domain-containing protein [Methylomonas sp.]
MEYGGGAKKAYCRLSDFVEAEYVEFYKLLKRLCLEATLRGHRDGVTVFIPTNETLKKIESLADSVEESQFRDAEALCLAHVIKTKIQGASDAMSKSKEGKLFNSQYPPHAVVVTKASGDEITFDNGAVAQRIPLIDFSRKNQYAAFKMLSGEMVVGHDEAAPASSAVPRVRRRRKGEEAVEKEGSYEVVAEQSRQLRWRIALIAENEYLAAIMTHTTKIHNPLLKYTASLVKYLAQNCPYFYSRVLPLISFRRCDLYIILEPHVFPNRNPIIEDQHVSDWWNQFDGEMQQFSMEDYRSFISNCINDAAQKGIAAAIYTDSKDTFEAIDSVRQKLISQPSLSGNTLNLARAIRAEYLSFARTNSADGKAAIFPSDLAKIYGEKQYLKLIQDEVRWRTERIFIRLEEEFAWVAFKEVMSFIASILHDYDETNFVKFSAFGAAADDTAIRGDTGIQHEMMQFVNSTHFLWIPRADGEIEQVEILSTPFATPHFINPDSALYDADKALKLYHERWFVRGVPGFMPSSEKMARVMAYLSDPEIMTQIKKSHPKIAELMTGAQ